MSRSTCFGVLTWLGLATMASVGQAQLFGPQRNFGRPLSRRPAPGIAAAEGVGQIQGGERFLRGNRGRGEFVGSDRRDVGAFVGSEQGRTRGTIVAATAGLQEEPNPARRLNRPVPPLAAGAMYPPRLELDASVYEASRRESRTTSERVTAGLRRAPCFSPECSIEALVVGRKAILRGEVVDAKQRDLAQLLVLFEPGISEVENGLVVRSRSLPIPPPPASRSTPPAAPSRRGR